MSTEQRDGGSGEPEGREAAVETASRGGGADPRTWAAALRALSSEPLPPRLRTAVAELGAYGHRLRAAVRAYEARVLRSMRDAEERDLPATACRDWPEHAEREAALRAYRAAAEAVALMSRAWVEGLPAAEDVEVRAEPGPHPDPAAAIRDELRSLLGHATGATRLISGVPVMRGPFDSWYVDVGGDRTVHAVDLEQAALLILRQAAQRSEDGGTFALSVASELEERFPGPAAAIRRDVLSALRRSAGYGTGAGSVTLPVAREIVFRHLESFEHLSAPLVATLRDTRAGSGA